MCSVIKPGVCDLADHMGAMDPRRFIMAARRGWGAAPQRQWECLLGEKQGPGSNPWAEHTEHPRTPSQNPHTQFIPVFSDEKLDNLLREMTLFCHSDKRAVMIGGPWGNI